MAADDTKTITHNAFDNIYTPSIRMIGGPETEDVLNNTVVKGHTFYMTPDQPLTTKRIYELGLEPWVMFDLIEHDSYRKVYLSRAFRFKHRIFLYLYIQNGNHYVVRSVYQSGSQVLFTLLPEYSPGIGYISHYGKGYGEASIRLSLPIQYAISQLLEVLEFNQFDTLTETLAAIAGPTRPKKEANSENSNTYFQAIQLAELAQRDFIDFFSLGPDDSYDKVIESGYFSQPELMEIRQDIHKPENEKLASFTLPSVVYTEKPLTVSESDVTFDIYSSKDKKLLYYIARSELKIEVDEKPLYQTWPCHVEIIDKNATTELGIRRKWFPVSAFTRPGLEYHSQASNFANPSVERVFEFDICEDTIFGCNYSLLKDERTGKMICIDSYSKYVDITKHYQMKFPMMEQFF